MKFLESSYSGSRSAVRHSHACACPQRNCPIVFYQDEVIKEMQIKSGNGERHSREKSNMIHLLPGQPLQFFCHVTCREALQ
ncbi:hypothetical protein EVAR_99891_1 [Eumeta japonica]|uniref:Uncharacterized protein n=1 Tax=Eumeta variegata TaxID=151549 RepID=A0A4C1SF65_EUMVA|nr:hypothetical protein EVAR_99891_1 [Eumeta japonica]